MAEQHAFVSEGSLRRCSVCGLHEGNPIHIVGDDNVNHPKHYTQHPSGVECITVTEHFNFNRGNAIKYIWRADLKNGLEDLKKARWYLDREIERMEKSK